MTKKIAFGLSVFLFFIFVFTGFYCLNFFESETVLAQEKVAYNLSYPGILPDHPLYFIKTIRDRLLDFGTRDYIKKAQLYLLFSDKRANASLFLIKKGKNKQAVTVFSKGEKYFLKIPSLLTTAKKQGISPPAGFVEKLKLSNQKHQEVGQELLKTVPQSQIDEVKKVMKITQEIRVLLEKL
ncbi:MAG: DUF5667 domain-containing protein [Patescibacteria group bacterium]|nr:DUF5667 domain-containing protein [Patescibacteria group bacterium]